MTKYQDINGIKRLISCLIVVLSCAFLLSCGREYPLLTNKLYLGTYENTHNCQQETLQLFRDSTYKYIFKFNGKQIDEFSGKYNFKYYKSSDVQYIIFYDWKVAFLPEGPGDVLLYNDCADGRKESISLKKETCSFRISEERAFWLHKAVVISRHVVYPEFDLKK